MERFGPYEILRPLGQGGMGAVHAARDSRLDREVALKRPLAGTNDPAARERMLREARAAARVNHPHVAQIYDVGEIDGQPYLAMELLEGEPLDRRLASGPVPLEEALAIVRDLLAALAAIHAKGVVHRDLKPGNIFLTPHGVKVLDFGLARPPAVDGARTELQLTLPGTLVGTPRYMAPEQWAGEPAGPPADLFATGAILFEMLAGRPAFGGSTLAELVHAIVAAQPPALSGGPRILAADRLIQRALRKAPAERPASAEAMGLEVDELLRLPEERLTSVRPVRAVTRLAVLPLKPLRPDPETDFLGAALADEIAASLSALESVVVRSPSAAARAAGDPPDFKKLASELEVDAALSGTLLRAGDGLRIATQLLQLPAGTVLGTHSATAKLGDLFALQEELARRLVEALKVKLSPKEEKRIAHDVPASPAVYEAYLRANAIPISLADTSTLGDARSLYESALRDDPAFAPAWARLGRVYRILGKYGHADPDEMHRRAGEAFRKALELNPDLPLAHQLYTNHEVEELGRPVEAMTRLLGRARNGSNDPALYAGLTYVLRYVGLLRASVAADERARRLDPAIRTSVQYTHYFLGDYARAAERETDDPPTIRIAALFRLGRREEALALVRERLSRPMQGLEKDFLRSQLGLMEGLIEGRAADVAPGFLAMVRGGFRDPEGLVYIAGQLAGTGHHDEAVPLLERSVDGGFWCAEAVDREPGFDAIRTRPEVARALARAAERRREAAEVYAREGGPALLGNP